MGILGGEVGIEDWMGREEEKKYVGEVDLGYKNDRRDVKKGIRIRNEKNEIKRVEVEIGLGVIVILGVVVYFME